MIINNVQTKIQNTPSKNAMAPCLTVKRAPYVPSRFPMRAYPSNYYLSFGQQDKKSKNLDNYKILVPEQVAFFREMIQKNNRVSEEQICDNLEKLLPYKSLRDDNKINLVEHIAEKESQGLKRDISVLCANVEYASKIPDANGSMVADVAKFLLENPDVQREKFCNNVTALMPLNSLGNYHKIVLSKQMVIMPDKADELLESAQKGMNYAQITYVNGLNPALKHKLPNVQDFKELNREERREFLSSLIHSNNKIYSDKAHLISPLLPNNVDGSQQFLHSLIDQANLETPNLSPQQVKKVNHSLYSVAQILQKIDLDKVNIGLKIPRKKVVNAFLYKTKKMDEEQKKQLFSHFGFELDGTKMIGYPVIKNQVSDKIKDPIVLGAINKLSPLVQEFSLNNQVIIPESKQLAEHLNNISKAVPQFLSIIGNKQHKTHSYTVDQHSLRVLQNVVKSDSWGTFNLSDKKVLILGGLFHDITKKERTKDKTHPAQSAFDTYFLTSKLGLSDKEQSNLFTLIDSHDWLEKLQKAEDKNPKMQETAFRFRKGNMFQMAQIFCEADLKAVKANDKFFHKYGASLKEFSEALDPIVQDIKSNVSIMPQTHIPRASELDVESVVLDGISNKVIRLDLDENTDFHAFAHEIADIDIGHKLSLQNKKDLLRDMPSANSKNVLSATYMKQGSGKPFREQGFLLSVDFEDILGGYSKDLASGYYKAFPEFGEYYFSEKSKSLKEYVPNLLQEKLSLTKKEYKTLAQNLKDCKSFEDIADRGEELVGTIKEATSKIENAKRSDGRKYNEFFVMNPKIAAFYAYDVPFENIDKKYRKFAADNDIPVVIFEKTKNISRNIKSSIKTLFH
ncbi:MAG: hypothetical protein PHE78_01905 [Candidatus Gastranaerophilales bacterium]|nr:hypothetical protein [Candidatus Gastranaerophilales bacterium]